MTQLEYDLKVALYATSDATIEQKTKALEKLRKQYRKEEETIIRAKALIEASAADPIKMDD